MSEEVLLFAAELGGLYKDETSEGIRLGDKIIAATAFLERGLILTRNFKHFPLPFFNPVEWFAIVFKNSGKYQETIDICLYEPRYDLITRRINDKNRAN